MPNATLKIATFNGQAGFRCEFRTPAAGIEKEHLHRIYDPFFTTKTKPQDGAHKGTGLGLAVSHGIMQEHAGKIHVEERTRLGTAFQLEFPSWGTRRASWRLPKKAHEKSKERQSMSEITELVPETVPVQRAVRVAGDPDSIIDDEGRFANRSTLC